MTYTYYNRNAQDFFDNTVSINMSSIYDNFLSLLPEKAHIIDAGCGSGRDTKYFLDHGYSVTSFDASEQLVHLAMDLSNHPIQHSTFLNFSITPKSQDGIWACASLLHVPMKQLKETLFHLAQYLKDDGIFYCSFKYGHNEMEHNGRHFTNLNETILNDLLVNLPISIKKTWITEDLRANRINEKWLNIILVK
ncbi:class I SAM-dependent methyltransferase [Aliivibrio logei]|uniref:SAM-dependent methyltransferase n=1 Tax=Aliivibrio logei TaxID=688 RepID=A0A1B9NZ60_ALILO|nr:class I SAM-dependent methyltransferase [Aliivibrio logei]OCH21303.1 SAM-dependent methyltransferase [Aliivibrio logei]